MSRCPRTLVVVLLVLGTLSISTNASAKGKGWLDKATGGKVTTPKFIQQIAPNGIQVFKPVQPQPSGLAVIDTTIREDGVVMRSRNSLEKPAPIGKAREYWDAKGQFYWIWDGLSRRVPRFDKEVPKQVVWRNEADPNTGVFYLTQYVDGQFTRREIRGQGKIRHAPNGQPYWVFGNENIAANNQPWGANATNLNNNVGGNNAQSQQQLKPEAQLILGILQAVAEGQK